jgi:hypothetical protein
VSNQTSSSCHHIMIDTETLQCQLHSRSTDAGAGIAPGALDVGVGTIQALAAATRGAFARKSTALPAWLKHLQGESTCKRHRDGISS